MTPSNTDTPPLRRSEVGAARDSALNITINDDEAERREARRRTILQTTTSSESASTLEESETLKKCLEIYNGNKLSRDNAWSLSLIDTLSTLLDRHHKSLNNFKVAGSSLEASSKVYGLRVDSVHTDVLRMSAGLNAQKFSERDFEADDDNADDNGAATGGDEAANPNSSAGGADGAPNSKDAAAQKPAKAKRQRKAVATVTKNKDTLNGRLDTVPLQDPVFGKLNSTVGSINSSNRLMNNILPTADAELRLRTTFPFWDGCALEECDFTVQLLTVYDSEEVTDPSPQLDDFVPCDRLFKLQQVEELQLRPLHSGYVISDTPEALDERDDLPQRRLSNSSLSDHADHADCEAPESAPTQADDGMMANGHEMSMAFDINAECEPMPLLSEQTPIVDVDYNDFDDLTTEERTAIDRCRGLRKQAVVIEDLRPVDASSKLEYSYRPMDKISQFWAGPSHWKFKRARTRVSTLSTQQSGAGGTNVGRGRRAQRMQAKKRNKQLNFCDIHDDKFIKLDSKYKARKANFQKKWEQRKLKLPTDLQLDEDMFNKFTFALGVPIDPQAEDTENLLDAGSANDDDDHMTANDDHFGDMAPTNDTNFMNASHALHDGAGTSMVGAAATAAGIGNDSSMHATDEDAAMDMDDHMENAANNTVLEIATDFEGAPTQVTKIIVPFAKRAKIIDMKSLKRCCNQLITKQMKQAVASAEGIPVHPVHTDEHYSNGMASFKEVYTHLPEILSQTMAESLSTSVAFYSVLHLANDCSFRLIPQENLDDFKIRQVLD